MQLSKDAAVGCGVQGSQRPLLPGAPGQGEEERVELSPSRTSLHAVVDHGAAALQQLLPRLALTPQLQVQQLLQLIGLLPLADLGEARAMQNPGRVCPMSTTCRLGTC